MLKYDYIYKIIDENKSELYISKENGQVCFFMDSEIEEHVLLRKFLEKKENLEKYVNYLGNDPNRNFVIEEILNL